MERKIVDHFVLHIVLLEYFSIADKNGAKIGILCVKYGNAKVLVCILSVVDDTKLITKAFIRELQPILKDLVLDKVSPANYGYVKFNNKLFLFIEIRFSLE